MADENSKTESDLEEINLFTVDDRNSGPSGQITIESPHLKEELQLLDSLFCDSDSSPVIYPIGATLFSIHTSRMISPEDTVYLALLGDLRDYLPSLDASDFEEYHGEYIIPAVTNDVVLKIDHPDGVATKTDVDLENIEFKVPNYVPPVDP